MADTYSAPASQILSNIVKNAGNPSSSNGLQKALENILSKVPKGQDDTSSVVVQNVTTNEPTTAPVVNVVTSTTFNIGNVNQSNIATLSGGGTLTGVSSSDQDQAFVVTDNTSINAAFTGSGNKTIGLGAGDSKLTTETSGTTTLVGGTGTLNYTAVGTGATNADLTNTEKATVSAGSGDDTATLGKGSYKLDMGSGRNTVTTQSTAPSGAQQGFVSANSHDGYNVSVDGSNRIILDDGQGHVSTLANVNVVQFSNGSTFVKASTADEAIIARMYEAVLNRTADANGIYNWWDAYNSGQLSLQQVGSSFLNSTEAQLKGFGSSVDNATFVTNLYHNLLERDPDSTGLLNWTNALNNGTLSRADVLISFTASAEGAATNAGSVLLSTVSGAGQDFTPHTFNVVPDGSQTVAGGAGFDVVNFAGNKSDFTTHIDVDRVTVFNAATNSTTSIDHAEYIKFGDGSVMINAANADQAVIARMYDAVLNRDADADGLHNWWAAHDGGMSLTDIAHSFLTSPEFQAHSGNLSDTAFVSLMYQNMFGRAPDQGGLENWTNALSHGMSREDVVVNIAKSLEGASHSAESIKIIDHTHTY